MGIYKIKPQFRRKLRGTATRLAARGVTPDQVTTGGLLFSVAGACALAAGEWSALWYLVVPVAALGRIACNALDGLVAEIQGSGRPAGELYNETADRLGDLMFLGGVAFVPGVSLHILLGAVALSQLASFVGIASKAAGGARRYDGPMGKPDRMFVLAVAAIVAAFWSGRSATAFDVAGSIIGLGGALTAWNRYRKASAALDGAPPDA